MSDAPSDGELIALCRGGDREAFGQLLERYQRPVFNAAWRLLGDPDAATDLAQAVFLKVWVNLERYDPSLRFFSWIYRITVNESINALKKQRKHLPLDESLEAAGGTGATDPGEAIERRERDHQVQAALMTLKPDHRAVIVLRHFLECSYREMAAILDIPEKTVKSRLFTARRLLKGHLLQKGVS